MEQLSDHAIMAKLRDRFEDSFRYDASGVPRVWTPNDDIDGEFRRAKEEVSVGWLACLKGDACWELMTARWDGCDCRRST
jgi:hypothetical protein